MDLQVEPHVRRINLWGKLLHSRDESRSLKRHGSKGPPDFTWPAKGFQLDAFCLPKTMDGIDLVDETRKTYPQMPVLVASGYATNAVIFFDYDRFYTPVFDLAISISNSCGDLTVMISRSVRRIRPMLSNDSSQPFIGQTPHILKNVSAFRTISSKCCNGGS